MSLYSSFLKIK